MWLTKHTPRSELTGFTRPIAPSLPPQVRQCSIHGDLMCALPYGDNYFFLQIWLKTQFVIAGTTFFLRF